MVSDEKSFKRTNYLIDKGMQLRYIAYNAGSTLAFSLIIALGIYFGIWYSVTKEFSSVRLSEDMQTINRLQQYEDTRTRHAIINMPFVGEQVKTLSEHQQQVLGDILARTNRRLIPVFIALLAFVLLSTLLLTHRIAGPLYRMRENLEQMSGGNLKVNFTLREKDQGKELAAELSRVAGDFSATLQKVSAATAGLKASKSDEEKARLAADIESAISRYTI
jgi:methyl-accepting chemotaxis protein